MPRHCERLSMPGGTVAYLCTSRSGRTPRCACGKPSAKQCDYPVGKRGRTCSRHLCAECAVTAGNVTRIEAIPAADIAADPHVLGLAVAKGHLPRREAVNDTVDDCPEHARKLEDERAQRERSVGTVPAPEGAATAARALVPVRLDLLEQLRLDFGGR